MYTTIIAVEELHVLWAAQSVVIVDCRFDLNDPEGGRRAYQTGHIPTAYYAHLDHDLSGAIIPGMTGRHPLPPYDKAAQLFGEWGIDTHTQVVVYDDKGGAIASRLWWLLRFMGHDRVAVLDGGIQAWIKAGKPLSTEAAPKRSAVFAPQPHNEWIVDAAAVNEIRKDLSYALVDSRAPERYRGEVEPIDPVAGHIPGAINLPFAENLNDGYLQEQEELYKRFRAALADKPAECTVFYCGSGVTACQNLLAYKHAGLGDAKLYPGSWSEWITDEERERE